MPFKEKTAWIMAVLLTVFGLFYAYALFLEPCGTLFGKGTAI